MASELHLESHNNQSVFCTPHSGPHRRSSRLSQSSALSNGPLSPNFLASPKDRTNRLLQLCLSNLCDQELIALGKFPCEEQGCSACCPSSHDRSSSQVHSKLFSSCTRLRPTPLGRAILASSLGPTHGLVVLQELDKARRSIALDTDLHLVYLLTPIYLDLGANLDWFRYLEQYQRLSASDRRVADLVGIEERFITRCAAGASLTDGRHNRSAANAERLALHRRFYTALTLYRLVCEDGLSKVAEDFGVNRGLLQSLQQQASTYAGMVTIFCNRLGWVHLERLLASFQSRLFYGIAEELVDLIRLSPLINVQRARALRSGGINSISSLANSRVSDVTRLLQTAVQFQRSESSAEATFRHRTIQLDDGSYVNEEEAAELAVQKAQELLREDLAAVYGANIVLPFNKVQKSNSQVEELCGSTPVKHSNRASPNDSSSSSGRSQNAFQSKSLSPPPTNNLPNTPLKRALSDVITTPLSTKRIKLSSSPNDCPLITIAPSSVSFTDSERFADLHHDEGTSLSNAYTAESLYLHTVEPRSSLKSISFSSQSQETFVLTTQLTAIIDNACVPAHTDSSNHSVCEPILQSTGDCVYSTLEPSFPFEYGMNDTLTCSMLDTAIAPAAFITPTTSMTQAVVSGVTSMQNARRQSLGDLFDTSPMHTSVPIASHTEHISITGVIPESQLSPPTLCHSEACSDLPLTVDGLIFSIVDVAKTTDIWSTFISDLTNWVKRFNRCTDNLSSIAIQPCWTVAEVTKPPPSSITWFSGPAGYGAVGGGVETRSDKHPIILCLAGLAICSSLLSPDTVFWVDLAAEKGLASEYPSLSKRLEEISAVLELITRTPLALVVWDAKWWSRLMYDVFGVKSRVSLFDPGTCGWIRDPDRGRAPLASEVLRLSPKLSRLIDQLKRSNLSPEPPTQFSDWSQLLPCSPLASSDWCPPVRNALYHRLSLLPEHVNQASAQCFLLSQWTDPDLFCLNEVPRVLLELEIPCHCVLSRLESSGFSEWTLDNSRFTLIRIRTPLLCSGISGFLLFVTIVLICEIIRPRQAFCSIPGGMLISADFCQLELRLLAHFSRDANILSLLSVPPASDGVDTSSVMPPPPNHDAFRKLAAHWLKLPSPDSVTSIQRQQAKQLCYALVYGMSARGLAAQLDIPEAKAQRLIDSFLRSFPGLQCFIAETIQSARRLGHVTTLKGRVRLLPALVDTATPSVDASGTPFKTPLIQGRSAQMRQHCSAAKAERQAVNTVIQGSAAEISKMAMLAVDTLLSTSGRSDLCRLVLHEHDELIYQISHAAAGPELGSLIRHTMAKMSKSCGLSVSLPVKLRAGPNWCDLEEVFWH
ncbi:unnamed protein product [Dicrocoelium dendriticum]|nr:unnamed protein product [Dicrocoelium dendriticum]